MLFHAGRAPVHCQGEDNFINHLSCTEPVHHWLAAMSSNIDQLLKQVALLEANVSLGAFCHALCPVLSWASTRDAA